jgi:capsular polysaccharide biosynthesis protein
MAKNLTQHSPYNDEIDLREIIKMLIESKKLIISTILIFTIASIIYSLSLKSSFLTSTKLEIGYFDLGNGDRELIESSSDLVSELNILLLKNPNNIFSQKVSINDFENQIIYLETTSSLLKKNENLLTEMIKYVHERHDILKTSIDVKKRREITREIEDIKAEITHFQSKLSDQTQSQYMNIIKNLDKETEASELIDLFSRNSAYTDRVFVLNQKLAVLIENLEMLNSKIYSKTHLIGNIETKTIKPKIELIIVLGLIIGFIFSIFLVFIRNFVKSYKENQA